MYDYRQNALRTACMLRSIDHMLEAEWKITLNCICNNWHNCDFQKEYALQTENSLRVRVPVHAMVTKSNLKVHGFKNTRGNVNIISKL
jgi:hypothetical protein